MSKRQKAIDKLRRNPKNVRFEEVDSLLIALGFQKRQKGSHAFYTLGDHRIGIPFLRPFILPCYVQQVLRLLDELDDSLIAEDEE